MSEVHIVDIHEVCRLFATEQLEESEQKKAKNTTFNFDNIIIQYGEPTYEPKQSGAKPSSGSVMTNSFVNRSSGEQPYTFKLNRNTTSECSMTFIRCFKWGSEMKLNIAPPNPVVSACCGMEPDIVSNKGCVAMFTKKLPWGMEQQVSVAPSHRTTARLAVEEKYYVGDFEQLVTFSGPFSVSFESMKGDTIGTEVKATLEQALTFKDGFGKDDRGRATFKVRGVCKAHWGINQVISISEEKLTSDEQIIFKLEM